MSNESEDDRIYKALGHFRRRHILDLLRDEPRTTGALCDLLPDLDRCTVMQHLAVLEQAELIIVQRAGRERWNHLNPLPIRDIHERWIGRYAAGAVDLLARMKQDLENQRSS